MNVIVPIKQVPETEMKPRIAGDGKSLDLSSVKMVVNPFDEYAIEEALQQRDNSGGGEVTVVTVGEPDSVQALRTGLAMGANNAARIKLEEIPGSDTRAIATLLASYIRAREFDLIFCGKHGVGGDNSHVPQMLAVMLDIPVVTSVTTFELTDGKALCHRQIEGKTEVVEVSLPAVISVDKGVNEPRYPKLKGIMAAKKATIDEIAASDLDVDGSILGDAGAAFELTSIELPPSRGEGVLVKIGDDPDAAAEKLVQWLKNDAKVI